MFQTNLIFMSLVVLSSAKEYHFLRNRTGITKADIAAYRSYLTLDWLLAEDSRQRELADALDIERSNAPRSYSSNCLAYPRPSANKIGRLLIELLKNLEGDDGSIMRDLIHGLVRNKILVEPSMFEEEPNFMTLVKTNDMMKAEPHTTFPRIMGVVWLAAADTSSVNKWGWCPVSKLNRYMGTVNPRDIARQFRPLEAWLSRARFVMEEFIQNVTPLNILQRTTTLGKVRKAAQLTRTVPLEMRRFQVQTTNYTTTEYADEPSPTFSSIRDVPILHRTSEERFRTEPTRTEPSKVPTDFADHVEVIETMEVKTPNPQHERPDKAGNVNAFDIQSLRREESLKYSANVDRPLEEHRRTRAWTTTPVSETFTGSSGLIEVDDLQMFNINKGTSRKFYSFMFCLVVLIQFA